MPDFKQHYKNPRLGFGDANHNRNVRAYKQDKTRKEMRSRAFDRNRELEEISSASPRSAAEEIPTIKDERMKKLIKWREDRNRKKKLEAAKKKPVFKIGIVHHSLCSPRMKSDTSIITPKISKPAKQHQNDVPKRVTKATEKRLLAKIAKQAAIASKSAASTSTKSPKNVKKPMSNNKKQKSFAPINYEFRAPSGLQKMPMFGFVPMEQTPQEKGDFLIQNESTKRKALDTNKQKVTSSQKLNTSIPHTRNTMKKIQTSVDPMLSVNKRKASLTLNELIPDVDNVTSQLNTTITLLPQQETVQDPSQEHKSSSDSTDMKTPPQKTTSTNTSFDKNNSVTEDLIVFSPYLTMSRGKKNARKEQQQRLRIGRLSSGEIPTKDTVMKNLNISVEEEERTAQYFKFLLNKETDRLQELCRKWLDIKLENDIPDDAMYEINQAVGQTNLLINKKFERFRRLVQDCETGRGEMLVTCRDLQGFWDMTYMEIRDCDSRFEKLEQRRDRGWQEEECTVAKKPAIKKRMSAKKQIVSKPSSLRTLILAARKKKMETGTLNKEDLLLSDTSINKKRTTPSNNRRSLTEANGDTRRSKRRSKSLDPEKSTPAQRENSETNLIRKKHFSDTKGIKSPYAAMKISRMCKTPEVRLDDTISYVNSDQTPGKSILKKSEELISKEARIKSMHKVNFDDEVILTEVPVDEETQIKLNLTATLKRIDNLDLEELYSQECINAEKRLTFEMEDSDSVNDFNESTSVQRKSKDRRNKSKLTIQNNIEFSPLSNTICTVKESSLDDTQKPRKSSRHRVRHKDTLDMKAVDANVLPATPIDSTYIGAPVASKEFSNETDMQQGCDLGARILRNRTITTNDTPKDNNTSKMMTPKRNVSKKENKSPMKSSRKNSLKLSGKDENKYVTSNKDNITEMENIFINNDVDKRRRSTRKSVAFSAETCLACAENKPVLPMTPHSKRRSKTPSRQSRSKHGFDKDLTSWDTPEKKHLPNRVTRSHTNN